MTDTQTNTSAHFEGDGVVSFTDAALTTPVDGWARIRVDVCALCGSDKRLLASGAAVVPGHEVVGTIVESAPGAPAEGTRVVVFIPVSCGECKACREQQNNRCYNLDGLMGWQFDGGFAEYMDVPPQCLIPVPDDIPSDVAVLALDTFGTAAHALRLGARTQPGGIQNLLVIGCGPLGLGVVSVALAMGIPNVHAWDPNDTRLGLAEKLGATAAQDLESLNQYQVVAEVSGAGPARATAQNLVEPGGAILALGESNDPYVMPATPRWRRTDCFTVRSFYFPMSEVGDNWDLLRSHGARLRDTIMTPTRLGDLEETFTRFLDGEFVKPYITHEEI
ncbi:alcohol dehydrogenase catalytic domain-containing protein [Microbacterium sp. MPKO10]|uniref:alcohol dehydrogenase catalytic domain-containing protein n=1 Tax=Microbacterium sp. MPKO10 TaxID=2989818 RepID=UPI002235E7F5|nr:alcohol dehydrogenase catalytic domain-containing protein [Microbacterium sp. MPKO10]MCW4459842.1 alcohol dehydrogenase catalytic domain-containing protein [Microbacterium sp. MPKO10]